MLRILIVALVLMASATVWVSSLRQRAAVPEVATLLYEYLPLPNVEFIDQHERPFSTADLTGEFTLLFFGFTNCPDICPITLSVLADAHAELVDRGVSAPRVLFVSVDPARDTPAQIARYLDNFNSEFTGVTAGLPQLQPLLDTLGVTVQRHEHAGGSYNVVHNGTVFLLGPDAELVAIFGSPHDAGSIATDYLLIRQRYASQQGQTPASS